MKKINKENFKNMCELFNQLSYASTGIKASCFCGNHTERDFDDEIIESFSKSCKNIATMVSDQTSDHEKQSKQISVMQEAYKALTLKHELIIGILASDPKPSAESKAASLLLKEDHLEDFNNASISDLPHVVFVYYTDNREIKNIKWVKQTAGVELLKDRSSL